MRQTIRLGRIAGIEIGINWSWLIVFVLILWTLGAGVFPADLPGRSSAVYAVMAVVATATFFASLLLHELGHATVARREGMRIDGITLWLFGGVARFRGMFPAARAELRIALAGPAVTLLLTAAFLLLERVAAAGGAVGEVLAWLWQINLVLLVFNLLPAQPLDGGRVLHAILWARWGDLGRATRAAARAGEALGYALIAGGAVAFVWLGAYDGVWLAFLGWFVLTAARMEARAVLARESLGRLRVADLMTLHPITAHQDAPLGWFVDEIAWRRRHAAYPVVDAVGAVRGLLVLRDVAAAPRDTWERALVGERMVPLAAVVRLRPGESAADALDRLGDDPVGRALVLEDGDLVGLLSMGDLTHAVEAAETRARSWGAPRRRAT